MHSGIGNDRDAAIMFYENGDILVGEKRISPSGKLIDDDRGNSYYFGAILIYNNKKYHYEDNYNFIDDVDCNNPNWMTISPLPGKYKFYCVNYDNEITSLDVNGDIGFLLSFDDIENIESRSINIKNVICTGAITDDESKLYFYDNAYGSIRVIERNK